MFCFYFKTLPVSWAFMLQSLSSRCSSLKIILQPWPSFLPERRLSQDCIQSISLHCVYDWIWAEHPLHVTRQQCEVSPVWEWCTYTHTATDSVQSVASSATQSLSLLSLCVTADSQSAQFQQGYRMHGASVGLRRQAEANLRSNSYHPMASIRPGLLVSLAPQMATGPASCLDLLLPSLPLRISVFSPDLHVLSLVLWTPACSAYHHSFQIPFVLSTNVLSAFSSISAPRTNQF